jgi:exosortase
VFLCGPLCPLWLLFGFIFTPSTMRLIGRRAQPQREQGAPNRMTRSRSCVLLCMISLVIWWRPLIATFGLAIQSSEYTHILLILPVSAALVILQRGSLPASARRDFGAGASVLVLAALAGLGSKWNFAALSTDVALSLSMLGLVLWWIGTVIFCFGIGAFRTMLFPLLFLFWLVPLPAFALDRIVSLLQHYSASLTRLLFVAAGVPVSLDGVVLSIPGLDLEVAKECSSIRSSLMLMVTSMVLAHLFLRSPWRQGVVMVAAIPLSVVKNAVRIFTLSMLATHVDPGFLTGRLHHQGGIVFFLLTLGAICLLIWALQKTDTKFSPAARLRITEDPAVHP